ncbi:TetR/AcrR family transcriptional regulator [Nocardia sp. alder85J]|uniref:TetR/AcrR family transcriptional regulator n=1 Tax=Nocardia sp. alder85J TaxID=2862949 RepID=UPI001CD59012|nr:TetR family transcriptional regulator [Nocardia sp. alder85J]MCX4096812.1 TetR family transcriptional regulator [Nocardia sp. alder85J]
MKQTTGPTRTPRRQRRERGSISADQIVSGAYELAAEISVEKLSMPALAKRLDVGITSLYWYFRSKDQLLEAMTDLALEQYEIALPFTGDGAWDERLRSHFREMRDLFRKNPVLCDLLIVRTGYGDHPSSIAFERLEAVIETLVTAGFTPEAALDTYFSLAAHSRGIAMLERKESLDTAAHPLPKTNPINPETMPLLAELARHGYSLSILQDRTFEAGLEALIDRARRVLHTASKSPGPQAG